MLTVIRDRAGMTLEAGLPVSIVVTEIVEGSKWSVPSSRTWVDSRCASSAIAGIGFSALCR
jgi:hypothetical protein